MAIVDSLAPGRVARILAIFMGPRGVCPSNSSRRGFKPAFSNSATMYARVFTIASLPEGRGPKATIFLRSSKPRFPSKGVDFAADEPEGVRWTPYATTTISTKATVRKTHRLLAGFFLRDCFCFDFISVRFSHHYAVLHNR